MNIFCKENQKSHNLEELQVLLGRVLGEQIPVVVCIGTDAVVGDSLGPLVGSMLKDRLKGKTYVFGTVESPITAKEVPFVADFVKNVYPDVPVLAIDAALGSSEEIGSIKITKCPIKPGLGVDKNLGEIGTASIIGVVEEKQKGKHFLNSVRLSIVYKQAIIIATAIERYINNCTFLDERSFSKKQIT